MAAPGTSFSATVSAEAAATTIALQGEFDGAALPALETVLGRARHRDVVLDLEGLTFMDGAAWLAIVAHEHRARDDGHDLRLVNVPVPVRRIFRDTQTQHLLGDVGGSP